MDRKSDLMNKLETFRLECEKAEKPLMDICLEEAFPGDNSTSFILKVKALWLDELSLSRGLDVLLAILWATTDIPTRTQIFSICVVNSNEEIDCKTVNTPNFSNQPQTDTSVFV
jgi:hypothetical protein